MCVLIYKEVFLKKILQSHVSTESLACEINDIYYSFALIGSVLLLLLKPLPEICSSLI